MIELEMVLNDWGKLNFDTFFLHFHVKNIYMHGVTSKEKPQFD